VLAVSPTRSDLAGDARLYEEISETTGAHAGERLKSQFWQHVARAADAVNSIIGFSKCC